MKESHHSFSSGGRKHYKKKKKKATLGWSEIQEVGYHRSSRESTQQAVFIPSGNSVDFP
jgi:hypothetical protein